MCTAITYQTRDHYFGRNLDLEYHYNEQITITPRSFPFRFTNGKNLKCHYALIGMATVAKNYPLYYEATNEKGLSMAGLNFPGNAHYFPIADGKDNISPYEFSPWLLTQCATLQEARSMLQRINLCNIPFSEQFPLSPLHWLIADKTGAIVVESMQTGLHICKCLLHVLNRFCIPVIEITA
ncbi:MAG: linear amide C-N hydrolase [Clostridia bacterium]|nr:linear amide C-N hydrolase [Clostridia bacterium]